MYTSSSPGQRSGSCARNPTASGFGSSGGPYALVRPMGPGTILRQVSVFVSRCSACFAVGSHVQGAELWQDGSLPSEQFDDFPGGVDWDLVVDTLSTWRDDNMSNHASV